MKYKLFHKVAIYREMTHVLAHKLAKRLVVRVVGVTADAKKQTSTVCTQTGVMGKSLGTFRETEQVSLDSRNKTITWQNQNKRDFSKALQGYSKGSLGVPEITCSSY